MDKNIRRIFILIFELSCVGIFISICLFACLLIKRNKEEKLSKENETPAYESVKVYEKDDPAGEDYIEIDETVESETLSGDAGDEGSYEADINTPIEDVLNNEKHTKDRMIRLAIDSLEAIPFKDGGRDCYYEGFVRYNDVIDNYKLEMTELGDLSHGMDSQGFVIWLYRNTFGICQSDFLDLVKMYNGSSTKVSSSELQVGDIGLLTDKEGDPNHFGVCVGFDKDIPVFAHCTGIYKDKLPMGTNIISHLKSASNDYLCGYPPVEFNFFFRPDVDWEE